jgi:hypothetical protein
MALNTQQLQSVLNLIEVATKRGAWNGAELSQIGAVFDMISNEHSVTAEAEKAAVEVESASNEVF